MTDRVQKILDDLDYDTRTGLADLALRVLDALPPAPLDVDPADSAAYLDPRFRARFAGLDR